MDNSATFHRYLEAMNSGDSETASSLRHHEFESVWPQSGEVVDRAKAQRASTSAPPPSEIIGVHGGVQTRVAMTYGSPLPIGTPILSFSGSGDTFTFEASIQSAPGNYVLVGIVQFADGLVVKQTMYWGPAQGVAPWRMPS